MEEVSGAFKCGMHENICLKTLHVMSNIKLFATQDSQLACHSSFKQASCLARRMNITDLIDSYVTHLDQKC